jgi:hypothetical protein
MIFCTEMKAAEKKVENISYKGIVAVCDVV